MTIARHKANSEAVGISMDIDSEESVAQVCQVSRFSDDRHFKRSRSLDL
jgi:hypothetical protein